MDCVEVLLKAGAKAFFDGNNKEMDRSPIYLAIRQEYIEVMKEIFRYCPDEIKQKMRNSLGQTPKIFAAKNYFLESLSELIDSNPDNIN